MEELAERQVGAVLMIVEPLTHLTRGGAPECSEVRQS
jgi:hypothetical protein